MPSYRKGHYYYKIDEMVRTEVKELGGLMENNCTILIIYSFVIQVF